MQRVSGWRGWAERVAADQRADFVGGAAVRRAYGRAIAHSGSAYIDRRLSSGASLHPCGRSLPDRGISTSAGCPSRVCSLVKVKLPLIWEPKTVRDPVEVDDDTDPRRPV